MKIDHICVAVRSIKRAIPRFEELFGYRSKTEIVTNTRQMVNVIFLGKAGSLDIKLIEPSCKESPLIESLKKGEGLHHICFITDGTVESEVARLSDKGARVLSEPEKGEAFDDELIAFLYAGLGLNIEIIDTYKRRGSLGND